MSPREATSTADHAARLAREAEEASQLRALSTHPDVIALRVERVRLQVDRLMWTGIVLGLAFTMANVQTLASVGEAEWSVPWVVAWLLDPMVSLVLVAVLRAEQVTARWQVQTGPWVRAARWTALAATYVMNTWSAWTDLDFRLILLHSVPPLIVFVAAEAVTDLRERLTEAVHAAADAAAQRQTIDVGPTALLPSAAAEVGTADRPDAPDAIGAGEERPPDDAVGPDRARDASGETDRPEPHEAPDDRVTELVDLLRAEIPVTGEQAGAIFAVSDRTGRRLLAEARRATASPEPEQPPSADETDDPLGPDDDSTFVPDQAHGPVVLRPLRADDLEVTA